MKTVLIVHAHHESQSFSSAMARTAANTLTRQGHRVVLSDLYQMGFDPVSDRRNFSSRANPDYLKQQAEETRASETGGFVPELEAEIQKLESCDALIFNFPLWWFSMPGILKGWVDRVFPMGRIYGGSKLYEGGTGGNSKRAMVLMTTGGGPPAYDGHGVNPSLESILTPIHHGIFWFNGFRPLDPFVAWSPARIGKAERKAFLIALESRMTGIFEEEPRTLAPLADFPNFGPDRLSRFQLTVSGSPRKLQEVVKRGRHRGWLFQALVTEYGEDSHLEVRGADEEEARSFLGDLEVTRVNRLQKL